MGLRGYTPSANTGLKNKRTNSFERGHDVSKEKSDLNSDNGVRSFVGAMMHSLVMQAKEHHLKQPDGSCLSGVEPNKLELIRDWRNRTSEEQTPLAFEFSVIGWCVLYGLATELLHEYGGSKALDALDAKLKDFVFGKSEEE